MSNLCTFLEVCKENVKTGKKKFHIFINFLGFFNFYSMFTLPETNIAPENGWLEDDRFLLGPGLFSGAFAVSFREGIHDFFILSFIF